MMALFPEMPPIPLQVVLWPFLFGLGLYLIITAQPIGRPKPDLVERLRRLDVDERIRSHLAAAAPEPIFASPLLERMLRSMRSSNISGAVTDRDDGLRQFVQ